mgnify:FL=1
MHNIISELDFIKDISDKMDVIRDCNNTIQKTNIEIFSLLSKRLEVKQEEVNKFEETYKSESITDEEIKEMVGDINGL